MIVIGSDPHKRSYTCSAVVAGTVVIKTMSSAQVVLDALGLSRV